MSFIWGWATRQVTRLYPPVGQCSKLSIMLASDLQFVIDGFLRNRGGGCWAAKGDEVTFGSGALSAPWS